MSNRIYLLLVLLLAFPLIAQSQLLTGLSGRVLDGSRAAIPNAEITVVQLETGFVRSAETRADGTYQIPGLPPGMYEIRVVAKGFRSVTRSGIQLETGRRRPVTVQLEIGGVDESIEVTAPQNLIESDTSAIGHVIGSQQIEALPLSGRNYLQLATLTPGVNGVGYSASGTVMNGERPTDQRPGSELFVNGNREQSNSILLDGVENSFRRNGLIVLRPSLESIREFKVQTSLFSAEHGSKSGAAIDIITKSGTNQLHGAAYEFLRNSALDARNLFADSAQPPPFRQNQFGAALGGPARGNRLFFFLNYEGFRKRLEQTSINTVPNAAVRSGDFGSVAPIFDPQSVLASPSAPSGFERLPFLDSRIPASRLDPAAARLAAAYPSPQRQLLANNHQSNPKFVQDWNQGDARLDFNLDSKNWIMGRFSRQAVATLNPPEFSSLQVAGLDRALDLGSDDPAGQADLTAYHSVLGWTYAHSGTLLLESRIGFARFDSDFHQSGVAPGSKLGDSIGIPGANQGPNSDGLPIIDIAGYTGIGHGRAAPTIRVENTFNPRFTLTKLKGNHTLKAGMNLIRRQVSDFQLSAAAGRFEFTREFTANPNFAGTTGDPMASFLLGAASSIEQDFLLAWVGIRTFESGLFVHDSWRVNDRLTIELGLRHEYDAPLTEVADRWLNFDVTTGRMRIAGVNSNSAVGNYRDTNNFAPRFGFAFRARENTVIRGGYGVYFNTQGNGRVSFRLHRQAPFGPVTAADIDLLSPTPRRLSDGLDPLPTTDLNEAARNPAGNLIGLADDFRSGYVHQYSLQLQQQIAHSGIVMRAAFVGNLSRRLQTFYNYNQPIPGTGAPSTRRPLRDLAPGAVAVNYGVSDGLGAYHGLQLGIERRLRGGLGFLTSYTWGHSIDNVPNEQGGGANGPVPQDIRNRAVERASSGFDVRHRLVQSVLFELPCGTRLRCATGSKLLDGALSGWKLNTIVTAQTGLPFTPVLANSLSNSGASRPDRYGSGKLSDPTVNRWFDTSFQEPNAAWGEPAIFTFGNSGRNVLRGPGRFNVDLSLSKTIDLSERLRIQIRADAFNVFNTPQLGLPNASIGAIGAGSITELSGVPRQIQLGLRVSF